MVYRALTNMLVLPWPETSDTEQEWVWRTAELVRVVGGATKVFVELQRQPQWNQDSWLLQEGGEGREPVLGRELGVSGIICLSLSLSLLPSAAKPPVRHCLTLLQDLVSCLSDERPKSKQMLSSALSPSLDFTISLLSLYLHHADVLDPLMGFFLALFNSMRAQVDVALTERTTHTFMALLTREHLQEALTEEASLATRVVEK